LNFVAAVVVDKSAPIRVCTLTRIGVFVKMCAVKLGEAVRIAGEMGRSPIENDADPRLVRAIDKFHKFSWRAVAAGGGVVAERLIAPGAVVGMLHNGEQLDVGVAHFLDIGNQLVGEFAIGKPAVFLFRNAAPRAEMDFVNGDW